MLNKLFKKSSLKERKFNYKITFFIYKLFTTIYSNLTYFIENIFFKQNSLDTSFKQKGIFKQKLKININKTLLNSDEYRLN